MPYLLLSKELLYEEQSLPCVFVCVHLKKDSVESS